MTTEKLAKILNIMFTIIKIILEFGIAVEAMEDGTYVAPTDTEEEDVIYITAD